MLTEGSIPTDPRLQLLLIRLAPPESDLWSFYTSLPINKIVPESFCVLETSTGVPESSTGVPESSTGVPESSTGVLESSTNVA